MYSLPDNCAYGTVLLRHTLGLIFTGLHVWTLSSIFEVLGEFGWFYDEFFLDNHPSGLLEKIMGQAAFWGFTLMANSWTIFGLALFSDLQLSAPTVYYTEAPHMRKLCGD